jgi:hypothetical protein
MDGPEQRYPQRWRRKAYDVTLRLHSVLRGLEWLSAEPALL